MGAASGHLTQSIGNECPILRGRLNEIAGLLEAQGGIVMLAQRRAIRFCVLILGLQEKGRTEGDSNTDNNAFHPD